MVPSVQSVLEVKSVRKVQWAQLVRWVHQEVQWVQQARPDQRVQLGPEARRARLALSEREVKRASRVIPVHKDQRD